MLWSGVCFANDNGADDLSKQSANGKSYWTIHNLPHRDAHYKEMLTKTVMHIVLESCP